MPKIDENLCTGCGTCVEICSFNALSLEDGKSIADNERCIGCGMCAGHCPVDAIKVKEIESDKKAILIRKWAQSYAKKNGFRVNPDNEVVDALIKGLIAKEETHGARYCPCRVEIIPENICPCMFHKKEIEEDGRCHCGFFIK